MAVDFAHNFVLLAVHVEVSHTLVGQTVLQGLGNGACAYAHHTGLVAIDVDACFGLAELQVNVCHLEDGAFVHLFHKLGQHLFQFLDVGGLEYVLYRHTSASSAKG